MIFAPDIAIDLHPERVWDLPFEAILQAWMRADFEPTACSKILSSFVAQAGIDPALVDVDAVHRGGVVLTPTALFGDAPASRWLLVRRFTEGRERLPSFGYVADLEPDEVEAAADFIRDGATATDDGAFWSAQAHLGDDFVSRLAGPPAAGAPRWPTPDRPGIYRREHASLLIRSRHASVLLDPLSTMVCFPQLDRLPPDNGYASLDAVLVSHIHGDHWHLPSILKAAGDRDTPVVVPLVPKLNLLSRFDMEQELRLVGQNAIAPPWGSTLRFQDLEIDILPFFGEQPTREPPGPAPGVRNWGNCFRFNTPDFSAIVLVDAGTDPSGSMLDAISASVDKRGPADVVLSCLREFPSPFFNAQPDYWAALPFSQLAELFAKHRAGRLPSTTAGPEGVAELCAAASARYFLPYAHGFRDLGVDITHIGWGHGDEPSERDTTHRLAARLAHTAALDWRVGDIAAFADGQLTMLPYER
jgi:L-ascorbate metabolism protein UlaG (beta-lactamase superfamily)